MPEELEQMLEKIRGLLASDDVAALCHFLSQAPEEDLAEVIELLEEDEQQTVLRALNPDSAGEVLTLLDEATRGEVVDDLTNQELTAMVRTLEPDDAADVLGELPPDQTEQVLSRMPTEQSRQVEDLMRYPEDTAGGLMTPVLVVVPEDATVSEAVVRIRNSGIGGDLFYLYVLDSQRHLKGVIPLRLLVTTPPDTPVGKVMLPELITIRADQDQEEVANVFRKYDLAAVPVVDDEGRLLGRITYDDAMDVADEEAEEDLLIMAGTDPRELESASAMRVVGVRASWLAACMVGTLVTVAVAAFFKGQLSLQVFAILVLFGPSIAAMSGNSGVQTSTLTILGLATGGLAGKSLRRTYLREVRVAGCLAVLFGVLAGLITWLILPLIERTGRMHPEVSPALVAWAVGGAMFLAILYATTLGILLPFALRRLGVDPALASAPLVTTLNDSSSWAIYLLLATSLLSMGL
ncbi:MAG TPA: magnesium transporter [Phycisphaerae bacterium]|nr:magnesium transporter [Phycisphaerae bacterium]